MTAMYTHKGFKLTVRESQTPPVSVFDSRYPRNPALFETTSLDLAMKWVDGYLAGHCEPRSPLLADTKPPARTKAARAFRESLK